VNKARTRDDLSEMDEMALVGILSTQLVDHLYLRQRPLLVETGQLPRLKIVDAARNSILI
jgi:hypothetical protein